MTSLTQYWHWHRITSLLWYHAQTLCVPHHVSSHTTCNQIHLRHPREALRNFYLYLPCHVSFHLATVQGESDIVRETLFIAITTVLVIFTRYAAVFPLSELINFFQRHARGQRGEALPHAYQMMLFWAGLRGVVGVALVAGFKGNSAQTLCMTVLVVAVLTVVLFGGTTARMLEVLGIQTGVEDDGATSSDDDEPPLTRHNGRYHCLPDDYQAYSRAAARIGSHYGHLPRSYNHHALKPEPKPKQKPATSRVSKSATVLAIADRVCVLRCVKRLGRVGWRRGAPACPYIWRRHPPSLLYD